MPNLRLVKGNKAEFGRPPPRLTIPGCSRRGISFRIADGCRRFDRGDRYLAKSLIRVWSFCSASAAADEEPAAVQAVDEKECELEKDVFFREDRKAAGAAFAAVRHNVLDVHRFISLISIFDLYL